MVIPFLKNLPLYQSHKVVGALQVSSVIPNPRGVELHFYDTSFVPVQMPTEWDEKHSPFAGGYLVSYADGYLSFSPPQAFETGYKRIEGDSVTAPPSPAPEFVQSSQASIDVVAERRRQIDIEGWGFPNDDELIRDELAEAAIAYALPMSHSVGGVPNCWPFSPDQFDLSDRRSNLVKAGAFIIAEIERIDRLRDGWEDGDDVDAEFVDTVDGYVCFSIDELAKKSIVIASMFDEPTNAAAIALFSNECVLIGKREGLEFKQVVWTLEGMYALFYRAGT